MTGWECWIHTERLQLTGARTAERCCVAELGLEEAGSSRVHDYSLNTVMHWGNVLHPWTEKVPQDSEQAPD